MTEQNDLAEVIASVTNLWDEPLDEVHDVPQIVNAILAAGFKRHPCPCGCPRDMHIGEIGCPCGVPNEPPCDRRGHPMTAPADHMTIAEIIHDYATVRGTTLDWWAREDLAAILERRMEESRKDALRHARACVTQYVSTSAKWRYDRVVWAFGIMLGEIPEDTPEPLSPADEAEIIRIRERNQARAEQIRATETEGSS